MVTIGDHHEQEAIPFQGHFTLESSFRFRVISRWNQASVSGSFHVGIKLPFQGHFTLDKTPLHIGPVFVLGFSETG